MAIVLLGIASAFAAIGFWAVLPFSGGEFVMIAYCFYLNVRHMRWHEVITITDSHIRIEKDYNDVKQTYEFPRLWAVVRHMKPVFRGHPSRLSIRSHGKDIELGRYLVESERMLLRDELKRSLA